MCKILLLFCEKLSWKHGYCKIPSCSSSHWVSSLCHQLISLGTSFVPFTLFSHCGLSFYDCAFHSPFRLVSTFFFFFFCLHLSSLVIRDSFVFCRQVSVLFAVCFCKVRLPVLFYFTSPVVSLPSLYSPPFFALSEHHLPICRFLVPHSCVVLSPP